MPLKEEAAEISFEEAVNLFLEKTKSSGNAKQQKQPELIAVYGLPHSGKTFFIQKIMKELSKNERYKFLVGLIQTSDSPESDLKQFNEISKNYPDREIPFIFFHEISVGNTDRFTLEHFNKFTDKNLYIFNPERETIDKEKTQKELDNLRNGWAEFFHKKKPEETKITFISNPNAKIKKL